MLIINLLHKATLYISLTLVLSSCTTPESNPEVELVQLPDQWIQPEAQNINGEIHVLYFKGNPFSGNLYYTQYNPKTNTFSESERVNHKDSTAIAAGTIRGGKMAVDEDGTVHVIWNGSQKASIQINDSTSEAPLLYARKLKNKKFEKEKNIIENAWGLDGGSDIASDGKVHLYIAWHARGKERGEEHRRVYLRVSKDGGANFSSEMAVNHDNAGVCACCGLHVSVDNHDKPLIVYRTATDKKQRDIHQISLQTNGKQESETKIDTWELDACPMSSISSFISAKGSLITWEKKGKVYYQSIGTTEIQFPESQREKSKHSKLAISKEGYLLTAWTEGTGWQKGGDLAWQLNSPEGKVVDAGLKKEAITVWGYPAVVCVEENKFLLFSN